MANERFPLGAGMVVATAAVAFMLVAVAAPGRVATEAKPAVAHEHDENCSHHDHDELPTIEAEKPSH